MGNRVKALFVFVNSTEKVLAKACKFFSVDDINLIVAASRVFGTSLRRVNILDEQAVKLKARGQLQRLNKMARQQGYHFHREVLAMGLMVFFNAIVADKRQQKR
ncbi:hypothetical protein [Dongia deserti]|uniref:hypothetical protein n=1 Tax=Dongia deserti TaxID=2268030 RepID=UPI000E64A0F2|nr:hypothetical protein [Dongia deserti]